MDNEHHTIPTSPMMADFDPRPEAIELFLTRASIAPRGWASFMLVEAIELVLRCAAGGWRIPDNRRDRLLRAAMLAHVRAEREWPQDTSYNVRVWLGMPALVAMICYLAESGAERQARPLHDLPDMISRLERFLYELKGCASGMELAARITADRYGAIGYGSEDAALTAKARAA